MGLFDKISKGNNAVKERAGGFMDQIRCDEPSYLIWKWHPKGSTQGENLRENAIRWGSSLRVKEGEIAVFVYKQEDDTLMDFFEGPCDEILSTKNLPILASVVGLAYDQETPFQAEVYFINLAQIIQVNFAVPYFDVYDPRFLDFGVPIAVRGTISFKIADYRDFIKIHRLTTFSLEEMKNQVKDVVTRYVKDIVANAPAANDIPVIQIETKTAQITDAVEYNVAQRLKEDFGVEVSGVDLGAIEIDRNSEGYYRLLAVTKDVVEAKIQAETEDYVERLRIQREEGQYAIHKQTQTANIGVIQLEKQAEVGVAGAEALGKMGENGAGNINLGGGGNGGGEMNPAAMMVGVALGSTVGQNMSGILNNAMNPNSYTAGAVPPPLQSSLYHVALNGKASGPYDFNMLKQMAASGQFTADTLVWKNDMSDWAKAGSLDELKSVFVEVPPISKTEE